MVHFPPPNLEFVSLSTVWWLGASVEQSGVEIGVDKRNGDKVIDAATTRFFFVRSLRVAIEGSGAWSKCGEEMVNVRRG